jgi:RHS repeat-associated protein
LVMDISENINNIGWNIANKVTSVFKVPDPNTINNGSYTYLNFGYDATGNRVIKSSIQAESWSGIVGDKPDYKPEYTTKGDSTLYIRDAQGNVLATYKRNWSYQNYDKYADGWGAIQIESIYLYGSSRIGELRPDEGDQNTQELALGRDDIPYKEEFSFKFKPLKGEIDKESAVDGAVEEDMPKVEEFSISPNAPVGFDPKEDPKLSRIVVGLSEGDLEKFAAVPAYAGVKYRMKWRYRGGRHYELCNHLGNVQVVVTDKKIAHSFGGLDWAYYTADVYTASDYGAFGMEIEERGFVRDNKYRYSFNGKETDDETGVQDYGFRMSDPRLARFWSVDPLVPKYPWYTTYQFAGNKPVWAVDLDGAEEYYTSHGQLIGKYGTSTEIRVVYDEYSIQAKDVLTSGIISPVINNILYNKASAGAFKSPDATARDWGTKFNEKSISENTEYASVIFMTVINDKKVFSYTKPTQGKEFSSEATFTEDQNHWMDSDIHTHGGFQQSSDNYFSSGKAIGKEMDIEVHEKSQINAYVTTPNGSLLKFNPISGIIKTLSCDMPSDKKDPTTDKSVKESNNSAPIILDEPKK